MHILLVWCSVLSAVYGSHVLLGADGGAGLYSHYSGEYAATYDNYQPHDYQFDYAVSDPHTGDHKAQWEVKEHGVVRGGYSLLEPDGTTRVVEYIADDHGFRAVVKKLGTSIHPSSVETHGISGGYAASQISVASPIAVAAPVAVAAPLAIAKPLAISAPVAVSSHVDIAAPQLSLSAPLSVSSHAQDLSYLQTAPQLELTAGHAQSYAAVQGIPQLHAAQDLSLLQGAQEASLASHVQEIASVQSLPAQEVHSVVQTAPQVSVETHTQQVAAIQAAPVANVHFEQAQQPVLSQLAVEQYAEKEPLTYSSYDGSVSNYANVLSAAVQHLKPISYSKPIEIPHSVELHGYQNSAAVGGYQAQNIVGYPAQNLVSHATAQNLISHASPAIALSSGQQSGYSYHIPHSAPIISNEISVPKAEGLAGIELAAAPLKSASIANSAYLASNSYIESAALKAPAPCDTPVPVYQNAVPYQAAISQAPQWAPQQSLGYSSQVHGLTGNLQDDSQYTSYGGHGGGYQLSNSYPGLEIHGQPSPSYLAKRNAQPLPYARSYVITHPTPK